MPTLKKTYHFFFFLGIFLLPFNSDIPNWLGFLGEYSADSSPVFFLLSTFFLGLTFLFGKPFYYPFKTSINTFLLIFTGVMLCCTLVNIPEMLTYYFKQTSGLNRFFRQFIAYILSAFVFFFTFLNICKDLGVEKFFKKIRKIALIGLILVSICGVLEYLILIFHVSALRPVINLFDYLPFVEITLDFRHLRVSSLTPEPPFLAIYLITVFGFMFSYIFTEKKKNVLRFLPVLMVIFLALVSKSRTAFIIIGFQLITGCIFAYLKYARFRRFSHKALLVALGGIILGLVVFYKPLTQNINQRLSALDFTKIEYNPNNNSISNKSRFGIQYAMLQTFKQQPIFGTGWGQQAYISHYEYPRWATKNNYEFDEFYLNENITSFPPGYNIYLRILAETGILGFLAFMAFVVVILIDLGTVYKRFKHKRYISIALLMTIPGFLLNWLQIDTFRMYGFWLAVAILIVLKREYES